ncbi:MAG: VOC family protein [Fimbriimonadaceae bacterium]
MRILETALYAEDLDAARQFYVDVLGLEVIHFDPERDLFMRLERSVLIVFKASRTRIHDSNVPPHGTVGAGHVAFEADRDGIEEWKVRLEKAHVPITQEIDWPNGARSIYFEDPAGNVLEFATRDLWFSGSGTS